MVAHRLHISARTLRRRLAQQGASFRGIDREIRHTLALDYLQKTDLPIKQVADFLGFENPANFTRAFQGWAGCSPRGARRRQASALDAAEVAGATAALQHDPVEAPGSGLYRHDA
jgi:AraC-like DNA-binding protein